MAQVLFKFGTQQQYQALETKQSNALYFLTDTGELFRGELPIARAHIYSGIRTANATNQQMITSLTTGHILASNDLVVIQNSDSTVDAFVYNDNDEWIQISSSTDSSLASRVSTLEGTVSDLQTLAGSAFHFQGSTNDLSLIDNPSQGDVYQVGSDEYAWNGSTWVQLGPTLSGLALASDVTALETLLGHPADPTADPAVPATGLFAELATTPENLIPLFNGSIAGLVPVASGANGATLTNEQKANMYLNALGNWSTVSSGGGQQTYTDPVTGVVYNSLEEYVTYLIENGALEWEELDTLEQEEPNG